MDGSRELVAAILRDNWLMREALWLAFVHCVSSTGFILVFAPAGPMRTLSFLLAWDSLVAREQTAVLTSSRHAKMIEKGTLATDSVSGLGAW